MSERERELIFIIIKVQDIVFQLHRFISTMSKYHTDCYESMKSISNIFPIEVDLPIAILNDLKLNNDDVDDDEERNDDQELLDLK